MLSFLYSVPCNESVYAMVALAAVEPRHQYIRELKREDFPIKTSIINTPFDLKKALEFYNPSTIRDRIAQVRTSALVNGL